MLAPQLPHRSRQLLTTLEARLGRPEYEASRARRRVGGARSSLGVVVVGAGPVGLRAAIELRLLGADVEVLEARDRFARLQVLHLWEWVEADLTDLGIKVIDPSIFATTDVRRCQTSQMQHSLMKVALLLGISVRFGCKVDSVASLNTMLSKRLDVLVDASGARCSLLETLGFSQQVLPPFGHRALHRHLAAKPQDSRGARAPREHLERKRGRLPYAPPLLIRGRLPYGCSSPSRPLPYAPRPNRLRAPCSLRLDSVSLRSTTP